KPIVPRSENQLKLVKEYEKNDMLFAIGPAGSGKTYTAIALTASFCVSGILWARGYIQ
ncbi:MAG: PhoH family protein, partial [Oscillospiraceae bacterium]|nr:PhoH family protein [Oscillospiraceae bacterium]